MHFGELFAADHTAIDSRSSMSSGAYSATRNRGAAMYSGLMLGSGRFAHVLRTYATDTPHITA